MTDEFEIPVLTYQIASGDLYYTVEGERTIYLREDPVMCFTLHGEIPYEREVPSINFAQVILEITMSGGVPRQHHEVTNQLKPLCKRIGHVLAEQIEERKPNLTSLQRVAQAMGCILRSMDATFTVQKKGNELRYELDQCPLCTIAKAKGFAPEIEPAHQVLKSICNCMVGEIDPACQVKLPDSSHDPHIITIIESTKQVAAG